jgi:chemotaxis protein histidine kinase CheA
MFKDSAIPGWFGDGLVDLSVALSFEATEKLNLRHGYARVKLVSSLALMPSHQIRNPAKLFFGKEGDVKYDYVLFPVRNAGHWSSIVLANPGTQDSASGTPVIFVVDPLYSSNGVAAQSMQVRDMYTRALTHRTLAASAVVFFVKPTPGQTDFISCGAFVALLLQALSIFGPVSGEKEGSDFSQTCTEVTAGLFFGALSACMTQAHAATSRELLMALASADGTVDTAITGYSAMCLRMCTVVDSLRTKARKKKSENRRKQKQTNKKEKDEEKDKKEKKEKEEKEKREKREKEEKEAAAEKEKKEKAAAEKEKREKREKEAAAAKEKKEKEEEEKKDETTASSKYERRKPKEQKPKPEEQKAKAKAKAKSKSKSKSKSNSKSEAKVKEAEEGGSLLQKEEPQNSAKEDEEGGSLSQDYGNLGVSDQQYCMRLYSLALELALADQKYLLKNIAKSKSNAVWEDGQPRGWTVSGVGSKIVKVAIYKRNTVLGYLTLSIDVYIRDWHTDMDRSQEGIAGKERQRNDVGEVELKLLKHCIPDFEGHADNGEHFSAAAKEKDFERFLGTIRSESQNSVEIKRLMFSEEGGWHINGSTTSVTDEADLSACDALKDAAKKKPGKWVTPLTGNLRVKPQRPPPARSSLYLGSSLDHCLADATCNALPNLMAAGAHEALCSISKGAMSVVAFCEEAKAILKSFNILVEFRKVEGEGGSEDERSASRFSSLAELACDGRGRAFLACPFDLGGGPPTHAVGVRGCGSGQAEFLDSHSSDVPLPFSDWEMLWGKQLQFLREIVQIVPRKARSFRERDLKKAKRKAKRKAKQQGGRSDPGNAQLSSA